MRGPLAKYVDTVTLYVGIGHKLRCMQIYSYYVLSQCSHNRVRPRVSGRSNGNGRNESYRSSLEMPCHMLDFWVSHDALQRSSMQNKAIVMRKCCKLHKPPRRNRPRYTLRRTG